MDVSVERPLVTVGLPVYNGERYLAEALEAALAQDLDDLEVVVCDNASEDSTREIALDYVARDRRVRYHRNERNLGLARNFNRVFELSRGKYFKWTAHDDCTLRRPCRPVRGAGARPFGDAVPDGGGDHGRGRRGVRPLAAVGRPDLAPAPDPPAPAHLVAGRAPGSTG